MHDPRMCRALAPRVIERCGAAESLLEHVEEGLEIRDLLLLHEERGVKGEPKPSRFDDLALHPSEKSAGLSFELDAHLASIAGDQFPASNEPELLERTEHDADGGGGYAEQLAN